MLNEIPSPAALHVLLNHLPTIGLAIAAVALLIGLVLCERAAQVPALLLIVLLAAATYPVYETGTAAYRSTRAAVDNAGADWLDEHMDRADRATPVYFGLAAIAILALVIPLRWPRTAGPLAFLTLLAAITCLTVSAYIALPGYQIRHPELRPAPPPPALPL